MWRLSTANPELENRGWRSLCRKRVADESAQMFALFLLATIVSQTALYPVINQLEHAAGFAIGDSDRSKVLASLKRYSGCRRRMSAAMSAYSPHLLSISTAGTFDVVDQSAAPQGIGAGALRLPSLPALLRVSQC